MLRFLLYNVVEYVLGIQEILIGVIDIDIHINIFLFVKVAMKSYGFNGHIYCLCYGII